MVKAGKKKDIQLNRELILNSYIFRQLGFDSFSFISGYIKEDHKYDGIGADGYSNYLSQILIACQDNTVTDKIKHYDLNITNHLSHINRGRINPVKLKYFQYLYLIFTEYYLDMYFNNRAKLLDGLNKYIEDNYSDEFAFRLSDYKYKECELNNIALWSATGSGKTILLHINYLQFRHYSKGKYRKDMGYLLITPNERLSEQHIVEFELSNIYCEKFSKINGLSCDFISALEITKLEEKDGVKSVAVESLGDDNILFVDEGHRGSKGDTWVINREKLCKNGFSFEYSATFGQAAAQDKKIHIKYAKNIIFDYSYKYFYNDGYGKDYRIFNYTNKDNQDAAADFHYMTGSLISFYQQMKYYEENKNACIKFNISKPLFAFVGNKVNAANSDIIQILIFIRDFLGNKNRSVTAIGNIMKSSSGFIDKNKQDIFTSNLSYLHSLNISAEDIYKDILRVVFHQSGGECALHIENIKGAEGEISLRAGTGDSFGVINIGDTNKLIHELDQNNFHITDSGFKDSLFNDINKENSPINILIGAKKFTEGWNSWRVSAMGLLNVGKKEGSQIIQLFGRGVRLKGYDMSLKRSEACKRIFPKLSVPKYFTVMEYLNIFGINANYMKEFENMLAKENIDNKIISYAMPVIRNTDYHGKLFTVKLRDGINFKRNAANITLKYDRDIKPVILEIFQNVNYTGSQTVTGEKLIPKEYHIFKKWLPFFDYDKIYFEMQRYKNITGSYNINIIKEKLKELLECDEKWSVILSYEDINKINSYGDMDRIENIAVSLLKKYFDRYYFHKKNIWEEPLRELTELDDSDTNFIEDDMLHISMRKSNDLYAKQIEKLIYAVEEAKKSGNAVKVSREYEIKDKIKYVSFSSMLYHPLLNANNKMEIKISPVSLVDSEINFLDKLKYYLQHKNIADDVYIIRNKSRSGVGFFAGSGFYPDFIMWVIRNGKQYINFIDPHGISRVSINDTKIMLYRKIKDTEARLKADSGKDIVLNSFIISPKDYNMLDKPEWQEDWEAKNVLFHDEAGNYIEKLFDKIYTDV